MTQNIELAQHLLRFDQNLILGCEDQEYIYDEIQKTLDETFTNTRMIKVIPTKKKDELKNSETGLTFDKENLFLSSIDSAEVFLQILSLPFDGIIIDYNLENFGKNWLNAEKTTMNGSILAKKIRSFNKTIPIVVYSAINLDGKSYTKDFDVLHIMKLHKSIETWKTILTPFLSKVDRYKKIKTKYQKLLFQQTNLNSKTISDNQYRHLAKVLINNYNKDSLFNEIGNYSWIIHSNNHILMEMGALLSNSKLSSKQKQLANIYCIEQIDNLNDEYFKKATHNLEYPSIIFPNIRTLESFEENFRYHLVHIVKSNGIAGVTLNIQFGQKLAEFMYNKEIDSKKFSDLYPRLSDIGKLEYHEHMNTLNNTLVETANAIVKSSDQRLLFFEYSTETIISKYNSDTVISQQSLPIEQFKHLPFIEIDQPIELNTYQTSNGLHFQIQSSLKFDAYDFYNIKESDFDDSDMLYDSDVFKPKT